MTTALVQYGKLLLARWRWVVWGVLIALSAMTVMMFIARPVYGSDATVLIRTPGDVSRVQDGGDSFARARADTYAELAKGTGVSARIVADLGLDVSAEQFSGRVNARTRPNTALLDVSVQGPSAAEAQRGVTVLISELQSTVKMLETVPGSVIPRAELVVANPPGPAERIWAWGLPIPAVLVGVVLLGAFTGALAAVLRAMFSRSSQGGEADGAGPGVSLSAGDGDGVAEDGAPPAVSLVDGAALLVVDGGADASASAGGDVVGLPVAGDDDVEAGNGPAPTAPQPNGTAHPIADNGIASDGLKALSPTGDATSAQNVAGPPGGRHRRRRQAVTAIVGEASSDVRLATSDGSATSEAS